MTEAEGAVRASAARRGGLFYGWWIVAATAALQGLFSALFWQSYGAYVVLLRDEFGWSKTMLSTAYSFAQAESGTIGPVTGVLLDRFGPRAVMRAGVIIAATGLMLFSQVQSPFFFFVTFIMIAIGAGMAGFLAATTSIVNWFERKRSTAIGLVTAGFALGGMAVPITVRLLETFGWRATAFGSGVAVLALGLPLVQVVRHRPGPYGHHPDGIAPGDPRHAAHAAARTHAGVDFSLRQALHTPAFWLIALGHGSALVIVSAVQVHTVAHVKESLGYSLAGASGVITLMTMLQFTGTLTGGWLGDHINKRVLVVACMVMHASGILLLAHATGFAMVAGFCVLHGLAWGIRGPQMTAIRADYFGAASFGSIMGISMIIVMIGSVSGPIVAGVLYDTTGSYIRGFEILAAVALVGSLFFVASARPGAPGARA